MIPIRCPPFFLGSFKLRHNEVCDVCSGTDIRTCAWILRGELFVLYLCRKHEQVALSAPINWDNRVDVHCVGGDDRGPCGWESKRRPNSAIVSACPKCFGKVNRSLPEKLSPASTPVP